jgi:hypothetical protein
VVLLRTWRSPRNGAQLCAEVCDHCWRGGLDDDCRTCRRKRERAADASPQKGVRPLRQAEAIQLMLQMDLKKRRAS